MKKLLTVLILIPMALSAMEQPVAESNTVEMSEMVVTTQLRVKQAITFDPNAQEAFTHASFAEGIKECQENSKPYILAMIKTKRDDGQEVCHFYDGRELLEFYKNKNEYKDIGTNLVVQPSDIEYCLVESSKIYNVASHEDVIKKTILAESLESLLQETRIAIPDGDVSNSSPETRVAISGDRVSNYIKSDDSGEMIVPIGLGCGILGMIIFLIVSNS